MKYIEKDFPIERLNEIALKEVHAKKPIYQIHKWWARRLGSIFRMITLTTFLNDDISEEELWRKFYSKTDLGGKIVLDSFMGGGTTIVEALRLGCKVIGIDIHPVAWFITKKEVEPVDLKELDKAFKELKERVADELLSYYKTICPDCYREADVMYVFWVKKVKCINCGGEVPLFNSFRIASKKNTHVVFCPNCKEILETRDYEKDLQCPGCLETFNPSKGYAVRGYYTCLGCGQKGKILRAVRREKKFPETEMYAIEYYCSVCKKRGYKKIDEYDLDLFKKTREEFERKKDVLLFPKQKIPDGYNTKQAKNFLYKYFYEMFNERQLLTLSLLLEQILKIENGNIREFILLAFSNCLDFNNIFCTYCYPYSKIENLFRRHVYWPTNMIVENNVWGTKYGAGTFSKYFKNMRRAKEYCLKPYETLISGNRVGKREVINDNIKGNIVNNFEDLINGNGDVILKAQTSEDLSFIQDKSVDVVITDPPYYDNVMYSELADFFYIWLNLSLRDQYESFQAEYSPRAREIIRNDAQGKDEAFFLKGLVTVFKQCNKVLKNDGLLVFTFHHSEAKAWGSVLRTVLDAGFYVVSVYPVQSEMKTSMHIRDVKGIQYDAIIVCRKRKEDGESIGWETVKDRIYIKAEDVLSILWKSGREISDVDLFVITMGKCLEVYSKSYPNVFKNGKKVLVEEAINDIDDIIDSLIKVRDIKFLPPTIDEETRLYIAYVAGREEMSYDDLHKRLSKGGADINYFFNENLLEKAGSILKVLKPEERKTFIEDKMSKGKELKIIDKVHLLSSLYKEKKPLTRLMEEWGDEAVKKACELLYKKTGEEMYAKIGGIVEVTPTKKRITTTLNQFTGE